MTFAAETPPNKSNLRARVINVLFMCCALLTLFRPPVSWNESVFLTSLKRIPVTHPAPAGDSHVWLPEAALTLHKSPYTPYWTEELLAHVAAFIKNTAGDFFAHAIGGEHLPAVRIVAAIIALLMLATIRFANAGSSASFWNRERLHNALLPVSLGLCQLIRWGALEQLMVAWGLVWLSLLPALDSKLDKDRRHTFVLIGLSGIALACAASRTWTYSLLVTALLWSVFQSHKSKALQRALVGCVWASTIFVVLFMSRSSFESLVSHLTQRWLYLNEPRYLTAPWMGPALLSTFIAAVLGLMAFQRIPFCIANKQHRGKLLFTALLVFVSAAHIVLFQRNPLNEDLIVIAALLVFCLVHSPSTHQDLNGWPDILKRLSKLLLQAVIIGGVLAVMGSGILALLPTTHVVTALHSVHDGILHLLNDHPFLSTTTIIAGIMTIFLSLQLKNSLTNTLMRANVFQRLIVCMGGLLVCGSELRTFFLWEHLEKTVARVPQNIQLFYTPKLEPLVRLLPDSTQRRRMAMIYQGEQILKEEPPTMLLLPSDVSEVCQAALWNLELTHGIFALCDTGEGALRHLIPME